MFVDMIYFILKIIMFIIIIYGGQFVWDIVKDTYTKPKTKDLVNSQVKKYMEMLEDTYNDVNVVTPSQDILFQDEADKQLMSDELSQFICGQTNTLV